MFTSMLPANTFWLHNKLTKHSSHPIFITQVTYRVIYYAYPMY